MRPVFLVFHTPAGFPIHKELVTANHPIFYLPAEVDDEIELTTTVPPRISDYVQIELHSPFVFLSVYGNEPCHLLYNNIESDIPVSVASNQKFVLLRDGDHFTTSAGRWSIQWDDEQGTIQNSMRPPPLLELPLEGDLEVITQDEEVPGPVQEILLSPSRSDEDAAANVAAEDEETTDREGYPEGRNQGEVDIPDQLFSTALIEASENLGESISERANISDHPEELQEAANDGEGNVAELPAGAETEQIEARAEAAKETVELPSRKRKPRSVDSEDYAKKRRKTRTTSLRSPFEADSITEIKETIIVAAKADQRESPPTRQQQPKRRGRPKKKTAMSTAEAHSNGETTDELLTFKSSMESTRSRRSASTVHSLTGSHGGSPKVYFASSTTIDEKKTTMGTFFELGGREAKSITEANFLCVGDGPLKKTGNLLLAIAQGAEIVTEKWVIEAHRTKRFPDPSKFLPKDRKHEREWKFKLEDAVQRGKDGLAHLLASITVFITAQLKQELGPMRARDVANVATALGAEAVKSRLPKARSKQEPSEVLVLGTTNDAEVAAVGRLGWKLYDKEILSMAVLRGSLDLDNDDFVFEIPVKDEESQ